PLKSRIQRFTACFAGDVQTGDRFEIRYLPGQGTRVRKNGEQKAEIGGLAFKRAVFGIWIGQDPVQQSLKEQMLAGRTTEGANRELLRERFVSEDIYFSSGAGRLSGPAKRKLADKAAFLLKYPQIRVVIEGHSDSRGPSEVNYRIARERARQVKKYLVAAGVAAKRLEVISYGEEKPASKGSPAGNRRVHLRIVDAAPENSASGK
ncbi:MAG TPA: chalcone isomerase family protein, partial [Desulfosalsimonadaceae bacterium]|nr:chalcone isomerase family protein [Desulfosalsimonadaceae bacterium]